MTNRQIYEIANKLGMIDTDSDENICMDDVFIGEDKNYAEYFEAKVSKDIVSVINFVDELALYNDLETIKKLLVAIIVLNNEEKK